jgi:hypothetical protein
MRCTCGNVDGVIGDARDVAVIEETVDAVSCTAGRVLFGLRFFDGRFA